MGTHAAEAVPNLLTPHQNLSSFAAMVDDSHNIIEEQQPQRGEDYDLLSGWARSLSVSPRLNPTFATSTTSTSSIGIHSTSHLDSSSSSSFLHRNAIGDGSSPMLGATILNVAPSKHSLTVGNGLSPVLGPTIGGSGAWGTLGGVGAGAGSGTMLMASGHGAGGAFDYASFAQFHTSSPGGENHHLISSPQINSGPAAGPSSHQMGRRRSQNGIAQSYSNIDQPLSSSLQTPIGKSTSATGNGVSPNLTDGTTTQLATVTGGDGATTTAEEDARIRAYAKLEFPSFDIYIQKLSVVIGRRPAAAKDPNAKNNINNLNSNVASAMTPAPSGGVLASGSPAAAPAPQDLRLEGVKLEDFVMMGVEDDVKPAEEKKPDVSLVKEEQPTDASLLEVKNDHVPKLSVTPSSPGGVNPLSDFIRTSPPPPIPQQLSALAETPSSKTNESTATTDAETRDLLNMLTLAVEEDKQAVAASTPSTSISSSAAPTVPTIMSTPAPAPVLAPSPALQTPAPNSVTAAEAAASLTDIDLGPIRAVSRQHARLYFDYEMGQWAIEVLGRNGVVVEGTWRAKGEKERLGKRTKIQIAERIFYFVLPTIDTPATDPVAEQAAEDSAATLSELDESEDEDDEDDSGDESSSLSDVSESQIELSPIQEPTLTATVPKASGASKSKGKGKGKGSKAKSKGKAKAKLDDEGGHLGATLDIPTPLPAKGLGKGRGKGKLARSASKEDSPPPAVGAVSGKNLQVLQAVRSGKGGKGGKGALPPPPRKGAGKGKMGKGKGKGTVPRKQPRRHSNVSLGSSFADYDDDEEEDDENNEEMEEDEDEDVTMNGEGGDEENDGAIAGPSSPRKQTIPLLKKSKGKKKADDTHKIVLKVSSPHPVPKKQPKREHMQPSESPSAPFLPPLPPLPSFLSTDTSNLPSNPVPDSISASSSTSQVPTTSLVSGTSPATSSNVPASANIVPASTDAFGDVKYGSTTAADPSVSISTSSAAMSGDIEVSPSTPVSGTSSLGPAPLSNSTAAALATFPPGTPGLPGGPPVKRGRGRPPKNGICAQRPRKPKPDANGVLQPPLTAAQIAAANAMAAEVKARNGGIDIDPALTSGPTPDLLVNAPPAPTPSVPDAPSSDAAPSPSASSAAPPTPSVSGAEVMPHVDPTSVEYPKIPEVLPDGEKPPLSAPSDNLYLKPPYTYASLIAQAVSSTESRKLTLNAIYDWITARWPYFSDNQNGWQNSIRHNLTLSRGFLKIPRRDDEPGKGAFWAIDPAQISNFDGLNFRKKLTKPTVPSGPRPTLPPKPAPIVRPPKPVGGGPPKPPIKKPGPSGRPGGTAALAAPLPIVVGPIPDSYVRPTPSKDASTAPDDLTAALLKDPPIVLHEGKLILNPGIFESMPKERLDELQTMAASAALQILQAHVVEHFKRKLAARTGGLKGTSKASSPGTPSTGAAASTSTSTANGSGPPKANPASSSTPGATPAASTPKPAASTPQPSTSTPAAAASSLGSASKPPVPPQPVKANVATPATVNNQTPKATAPPPPVSKASAPSVIKPKKDDDDIIIVEPASKVPSVPAVPMKATNPAPPKPAAPSPAPAKVSTAAPSAELPASQKRKIDAVGSTEVSEKNKGEPATKVAKVA
ncbi:hypothetical protein T439DRAFT_354346 [Meredithblackwellia eburnea MCA 4105]